MYAMFSKLLTAKAARKPAHWLLVNHHIIIISVPDTYNIANASITNAIIKSHSDGRFCTISPVAMNALLNFSSQLYTFPVIRYPAIKVTTVIYAEKNPAATTILICELIHTFLTFFLLITIALFKSYF